MFSVSLVPNKVTEWNKAAIANFAFYIDLLTAGCLDWWKAEHHAPSIFYHLNTSSTTWTHLLLEIAFYGLNRTALPLHHNKVFSLQNFSVSKRDLVCSCYDMLCIDRYMSAAGQVIITDWKTRFWLILYSNFPWHDVSLLAKNKLHKRSKLNIKIDYAKSVLAKSCRKCKMQ